MPIVELSAYVLPDDHLVFKLFPGKAYRLAKALYQANAAFLDIRGLEYLQGDPQKWNDQDVLRIIKEDRLSRQPQNDSNQRVRKTSTKIDKVRLGFFKALQEAKEGDLVVVPLGDGLNADVAIGEFTTGPFSLRPIRVPDGIDGEQVTLIGRPVNWRAVVKKRSFSSSLIASLHSQAAFHVIGRQDREAIYRSAYENYVWGPIWYSLFETSKDHFTTADHASVAVWLNAFAALRGHLDDGGDQNFDDSFLMLGMEQLASSTQNEMAININSPGWAAVQSRSPFPLVLMALFALGVGGVSFSDARAAEVKVKSVGSAEVTCQLEVDKAVQSYVEALGAKRWQEACMLAKRNAKDAKLETKARLKKPGSDTK